MNLLCGHRPAKAAVPRETHSALPPRARRLVLMLAAGIWVLWMFPDYTLLGGVETHPGTEDGQARERVIVVFETEINRSVLDIYGATFIRELKSINAIVCEIDPAYVEPLKGLVGIKDVVADAVVSLGPPEPHSHIRITPRDLQSLAYTGPVTVRWNNLETGMNTKAAWDRYGLDGSGVKIAFIDSAVNYTLPDLRPGYLGGKDIVNDDDDPLTTDPNLYHGTEVASVAIGRGVSKVVGVAYNASYYIAAVAQESGPNKGKGWTSDMVSAVEWAAPRADIISTSFGFEIPPSGSEKWIRLLEEACDAAYRAGVTLVAGSGNNATFNSILPAGFENVISVGGHTSSQTMYTQSNGSVDAVAPALDVYVLGSEGRLYLNSGTSLAAPHAAALIALQMQYARQQQMEVNNGYHWEVLKHGAVDIKVDPIWQGKGKILAAASQGRFHQPGSINLMGGSWPLAAAFQFSDYAYTEGDVPVYYAGSPMRQSITLTNVTDRFGNTTERIEELRTRTKQSPADDPCGLNASPSGVTTLAAISVLESGTARAATLSNSYAIPRTFTPGLYKTLIGFEFHFGGNARGIKIAFNEPQSLWYATLPGDLDLDAKVNLKDFAVFAWGWRHGEGDSGDTWRRADGNRDGVVDWRDLQAWAGGQTSSSGHGEGFESGTFAASRWAFAGNASWRITSSQRHSGRFSAQAGDIQDGQKTALTITVDCEAGQMSFWRKVSSESAWDFLEFSIDGVKEDDWSGDLDWQHVSFHVEAGKRTFTWTYIKDSSSSGGQDTAWIDDIVFPVPGLR